jgi:hypothetical protein
LKISKRSPCSLGRVSTIFRPIYAFDFVTSNNQSTQIMLDESRLLIGDIKNACLYFIYYSNTQYTSRKTIIVVIVLVTRHIKYMQLLYKKITTAFKTTKHNFSAMSGMFLISPEMIRHLKTTYYFCSLRIIACVRISRCISWIPFNIFHVIMHDF